MNENSFELDFTGDVEEYRPKVTELLRCAADYNSNVYALGISQLRRGYPLSLVYFVLLSASRSSWNFPKVVLDDDLRISSRFRPGELLAFRLAQLEGFAAWDSYLSTEALLRCLLATKRRDSVVGEFFKYKGSDEQLTRDIEKLRGAINRLLMWHDCPQSMEEVREAAVKLIRSATTAEALSTFFPQVAFNTFSGVTERDITVSYAQELVSVAYTRERKLLRHFRDIPLLSANVMDRRSRRAFAQSQLAAAFEKVFEAGLRENEASVSHDILPDEFFVYFTQRHRAGLPLDPVLGDFSAVEWLSIDPILD